MKILQLSPPKTQQPQRSHIFKFRGEKYDLWQRKKEKERKKKKKKRKDPISKSPAYPLSTMVCSSLFDPFLSCASKNARCSRSSMANRYSFSAPVPLFVTVMTDESRTSCVVTSTVRRILVFSRSAWATRARIPRRRRSPRAQ